MKDKDKKKIEVEELGLGTGYKADFIPTEKVDTKADFVEEVLPDDVLDDLEELDKNKKIKEFTDSLKKEDLSSALKEEDEGATLSINSINDIEKIDNVKNIKDLESKGELVFDEMLMEPDIYSDETIEKVLKKKSKSFKEIIEEKKNKGSESNNSIKNSNPKKAFGKDKTGSKPFKNR